MSVDDLTLDEQLTYWVGVLAREDVMLSQRAESLFAALVGSDTAQVLLPAELARTLGACKAMLGKVPDAPDWLEEEGGAAISAALAAHSERNRYIHDALVPVYEEPGKWHRHKARTMTSPAPKPTPITLERLKQSRDDMIIAGWRITGLADFLHRLRYPWGDDGPEPQEYALESARVLMRGQITLNEDRRGISYWPFLEGR
jgi:hypothetical protein